MVKNKAAFFSVLVQIEKLTGEYKVCFVVQTINFQSRGEGLFGSFFNCTSNNML